MLEETTEFIHVSLDCTLLTGVITVFPSDHSYIIALCWHKYNFNTN